MGKTLLYIGAGRDVLTDLAFLPGRLVRVDSIHAARTYLLRDEEAAGVEHLIAYSADVAAHYATSDTATPSRRVAPLRAWGNPIILVRGDHGPALVAASHRLGTQDRRTGRPARIVSLPGGWGWLIAALAGTERAAR